MVKAIQFHQHGGPEVLEWADIELDTPNFGEVRLKQTAIGLNFIDTYHRTGLYPMALPGIPGMEAAGTITEIGPHVSGFAVGDRVAYCLPPHGAYAQERFYPAVHLVKLPDDISDQTAAATLLKGFTVYYLLHRTFAVKPGHTLLFHAAAGGVGQIGCQWAKHLGATVIGTVGGADKIELARAAGCDHVIDLKRENFVERVRHFTGGAGVDVVYDSIGQDTFPASLDCLKPLGLLVSFGNSSGPVTGVNLSILATKGSLFVTRPTLMSYMKTPEELAEAGDALFDLIRGGVLKVRINQTYALKDAKQAQIDLASRKTTGSSVLLP